MLYLVTILVTSTRTKKQELLLSAGAHAEGVRQSASCSPECSEPSEINSFTVITVVKLQGVVQTNSILMMKGVEKKAKAFSIGRLQSIKFPFKALKPHTRFSQQLETLNPKPLDL